MKKNTSFPSRLPFIYLNVFIVSVLVSLFFSCGTSSFHQRKYQRGYEYGWRESKAEKEEVIRSFEAEDKTEGAFSLREEEWRETEKIDEVVSNTTVRIQETETIAESLPRRNKPDKKSNIERKGISEVEVERGYNGNSEPESIEERKERHAYKFKKASDAMLVMMAIFLFLTLAFSILAMSYFVVPLILGCAALFFPVTLHSIFRMASNKRTKKEELKAKNKKWFWGILVGYLSLLIVGLVVGLILFVYF